MYFSKFMFVHRRKDITYLQFDFKCKQVYKFIVLKMKLIYDYVVDSGSNGLCFTRKKLTLKPFLCLVEFHVKITALKYYASYNIEYTCKVYRVFKTYYSTTLRERIYHPEESGRLKYSV